MKKSLCIFLIFIMLPYASFAADSTIECTYRLESRRITVSGMVNNYDSFTEESGTIENSYMLSQKFIENVYMDIVVSKLPIINNKIFTVEYEPSKMEVVDLCKFTAAKDLTIGTIADTDIEILYFGNGEIIFKVNKDLPNNKTISGTVNSIAFKFINSASYADVICKIDNAK